LFFLTFFQVSLELLNKNNFVLTLKVLLAQQISQQIKDIWYHDPRAQIIQSTMIQRASVDPL